MKLTRADFARAAEYAAANPKFCGNLHERMKLVISLLEESGYPRKMTHELLTAIYDLETEVKYYEVVKPPYGKRTQKLR